MVYTVIVADDMLTLRTVYKSNVQEVSPSAKIYEAENGEKLLATYSSLKDQVDLIITDNFMPEMDGLDAIIAIRELDSVVPICLISSKDLSSEAASLNVDFLMKSSEGNDMYKNFCAMVKKYLK